MEMDKTDLPAAFGLIGHKVYELYIDARRKYYMNDKDILFAINEGIRLGQNVQQRLEKDAVEFEQERRKEQAEMARKLLEGK